MAQTDQLDSDIATTGRPTADASGRRRPALQARRRPEPPPLSEHEVARRLAAVYRAILASAAQKRRGREPSDSSPADGTPASLPASGLPTNLDATLKSGLRTNAGAPGTEMDSIGREQ